MLLSKSGWVLLGCALALMFAVCVGASVSTARAVGVCPNEAIREAQHATALLDCRAYELVSPPSKNGSDIVPNSTKTFAAVDGNGVAFVGLGGFGDVRGTATDVQYVGRRDGGAGTSGWSTHAVNPPGAGPPLLALFFSNATTFSAFTPDLTGGLFKSWKGLTAAPNVAGVLNLYRLRNLDASESEAALVSASASPIQPPDPFTKLSVKNVFEAASTDLSHVLFQSPYDLTGDGSFANDGDLYEYADGVGVRRVGRVPSGSATQCDDDVVGSECVDAPGVQAGLAVSLEAGSSQYATGMISDDGSRILFQGPAGAPSGPIYMREDGTRTYQINASEKTTPESPASAQLWGMSGDGSRVYFTTSEGLIDGDDDGGSSDLYMYDVTAPARSRLTLLSGDRTNTGSASSVVGTSADGHYVYFVSDGQLAPAPPFGLLQSLYVWHDGEISYIGTFDSSGLAQFNTPATGWQLIAFAKTSRVTPDGRHLLFMSRFDDGFRGQGGYAGYDHGTCGSGACRELYVYSADSGSLACASCNPRASVATGDALTDLSPGVSASPITQHVSHALSDDGQHVFFSTPEALVAEDRNGKWDAYEYDVASGSVHLISTGTSASDSYFMDASPDGHNAFFVTRQRLLGWDIDDNYDLYDARVGGGFPEPVPVGQACAGEGCRGALSGAPGVGVPGTQVFSGAGNVVAPVVGKHVVKKVSGRQRLGRALKVCKKKPKRVRKRCESQARKYFGRKASKSGRNK